MEQNAGTNLCGHIEFHCLYGVLLRYRKFKCGHEFGLISDMDNVIKTYCQQVGLQ